MNADAKPLSLRQPAALPAILFAGLLTGALDITAALIVYGFFGAKPMRLLQGIAAGLLGPQALNGGVRTATLGLFCHFAIALLAAAVYYAASRALPFLVRHAIVAAVLYGIAVYFVMNRVVVPLSAARQYPFSFRMMVIGVVIHIFCVGLPISLTVRRYSIPLNF